VPKKAEAAIDGDPLTTASTTKNDTVSPSSYNIKISEILCEISECLFLTMLNTETRKQNTVYGTTYGG
jgi:hypothetical protein